MGLRIGDNVSALAAQRQATEATNRLVENLGRLSTLQRINRAADDAAGLAIAEGFRAEVREFNREIENFQGGVNFLDTAEGGLEVQQEAAGRLEELALQASNGTLSDEQRAALNEEAQQLVDQIGDIANETEFNGIQPLNGSAGAVSLDVEGEVQVSVDESTVASLGLTGLDLSTQAGAASALSALETAQTRISENRANVGAQQNRLESAINQREEAAVNSAASESRIRDLEVARASIDRARDELLLESSINVLARSGIQNQNAARLLGI